MGEDRARTGAVVAGAAAIVLVASLFLGWYQLELPPENGQPRTGPSFSAWDGLERTDIYLLVLAIAALLGAVVVVGNWIRESNAAQITVLLVGLAAVFLVLYRGLNAPPRVIFGVELETSLQLGWFISLAASGLIAVGGAMALERRPAAKADGEPIETRPPDS